MDLTLIDGVRIEVGKEYWVQYISSENWDKVKITRITDHGHPWMVNVHSNCSQRISGILTDGWSVQEITSEVELEQFARTWLLEKGYKGFANNSEVPKWFAQMYNDFKK